jgi:predicted MFS family arabinose efflux permease
VAAGKHHRVGGQGSMNQVLQAAQIGSRAARLRCEFSIGQSIGHVIVWVVLTLVTFGLALLVFPYYLNRAMLNRTEVLDQQGRPIGRLRCNFDLISSIGHVIIWGILILITFGIAGFFYLYRVVRVVLSDTVIEYY